MLALEFWYAGFFGWLAGWLAGGVFCLSAQWAGWLAFGGTRGV